MDTQTLQPALTASTIEAIVAQTVAAMRASQDKGHGGLNMPSAWVGQDSKQVAKYGTDRASHYVYWIDPDGRDRCKSCGPGKEGLKLANQFQRQVEAELLTGTYQTNLKKSWEEFRAEYDAKVVTGLAQRTREEVKAALDHFERIINPKRVSAIKTSMIDGYRSKRRADRGKQPGSLASAATINKSLRHLRAALNKAKKWGYLAEVPEFEMERAPKKLPKDMTPDHFAALYRVCDQAAEPTGFAFPPSDWWRALLVTIHMAGRRIGAMLALQRADLDLDGARLLSQAEDNKGKRDQWVPLHPVAIEHLRKLRGFHDKVFPWMLDKNALYDELHRLEKLAGVPNYGFHSLKRAFCTRNAGRIPRSAMQFMAEHASYQTTEEYYINPVSEIEEAVERLYVPEFLRKATG